MSIGLSKTLFGGVDFNGTIFVDDDEDDDWVIHNFFILLHNGSHPKNVCNCGTNS